MKSILSVTILFGLLTCTIQSNAQPGSLIYYFDNDFYFAPKDSAIFVGVGIKEGGAFKLSVYIKENMTPKLKGYFTDSTLSTRNGYFTFYDSYGQEESAGLFVNNMEEKYWRYWYDGVLTDSVLYYHGEESLRITRLYYPSNKLESITVKNKVSDLDEQEGFFENGQRSKYSKLINGTGETIEYYPNGAIKSKLVFNRFVRKSAAYYKEDGSEISQQEIAAQAKKQQAEAMDVLKSKIPEFPGGTKGLHSYFEKNFRFPVYMSQQATLVEFLNIQFYLDKKGYAYDIKVENSANFELLQAVQDLFRNMPAWNMKGMTSYGPVNYRFNLTN